MGRAIGSVFAAEFGGPAPEGAQATVNRLFVQASHIPHMPFAVAKAENRRHRKALLGDRAKNRAPTAARRYQQ
jgi:hypothetical protein